MTEQPDHRPLAPPKWPRKVAFKHTRSSVFRLRLHPKQHERWQAAANLATGGNLSEWLRRLADHECNLPPNHRHLQ
jgi:hypothetical protein